MSLLLKTGKFFPFLPDSPTMNEPSAKVSTLFDGIRLAMTGVSLDSIIVLRNARRLKDDGSYVTEGDLLVQRKVTELVIASFPAGRLLSEESDLTEETDLHTGWVVVLDPIDGTENFTSGFPIWGISVCCYLDGSHIGSMIGCPELGSWLRTGDPLVRYTSRIRGLSSSLNKEQLATIAPGPEYRMFGCCVFNMLSVIRGSLLTFENPKGAAIWDILGGFNLAREHGLKVEVDGEEYRGELLSANRKYRFKIEGV